MAEQNVIGVEWITTQQGAKLAGMNRVSVRRLAVRGFIRGVKAGHDWLVNRADLEAYVRQMAEMGNQKHNPYREDLAQRGMGRQHLGQGGDDEQAA